MKPQYNNSSHPIMQFTTGVEGCVPVVGRGVAGHEEEDIRLWRRGAAAVLTQRLEAAHDVQSPSLVDQAGVKSQSQVSDQQEESCSSTPCFEIR